jgi:hypothetical protein
MSVFLLGPVLPFFSQHTAQTSGGRPAAPHSMTDAPRAATDASATPIVVHHRRRRCRASPASTAAAPMAPQQPSWCRPRQTNGPNPASGGCLRLLQWRPHAPQIGRARECAEGSSEYDATSSVRDGKVPKAQMEELPAEQAGPEQPNWPSIVPLAGGGGSGPDAASDEHFGKVPKALVRGL